jgi:hypothetical protein
MELWIWLTALAIGSFVFVLALVWLGSRAFISGKKLKPFADDMARFKKSVDQYPEAVEFYSNLAKSSDNTKHKP